MAQSKLIDRDILIAELASMKVALGDVFFGAVLDRAIECVERQPVVDAEPVKRMCFTCKHRAKTTLNYPCAECFRQPQYPYWEERGEE